MVIAVHLSFAICSQIPGLPAQPAPHGQAALGIKTFHTTSRIWNMSTLEIPQHLADRLRERAAREGTDVERLATRALELCLEKDPHEFIGHGSSSRLQGDRADELIEEAAFGSEP